MTEIMNATIKKIQDIPMEEFKKMTQRQRLLLVKDIPAGVIRDENGNEIFSKWWDKTWTTRSYNQNGDEISYRSHDGFSREEHYKKDGTRVLITSYGEYFMDKDNSTSIREISSGEYYKFIEELKNESK